MKYHQNHSKSLKTIQILGLTGITCFLMACGGEKEHLPKTFEAYQSQTAFVIKDLSEGDRLTLYQDSYAQNNELGQQVTLPIFNQCLDNTLKEHSSFMSFYKIYKICESKALKGLL